MAFNALCFLLLAFSLSSVVPASVTFRNELDSRSTSHQNTRKSQIISQLGPQLSSGAAITDANNGNLALATQRWQKFDNPNFFAAVQVASEADIIKTVQYATTNSIPFLAVNSGHGEISSLGALKNGIQITLRGMRKITVNSNNTATIQGGVTNLNMTTALWAANKQTVTGACECIGYIGPLLGGGHGFLQGLHGYVADNLIEARVVLYNGSVVVASNQSNTDLFWALRGAGHNFGIVSQVSVQIYDVPKNDIWYYATFLYPGSSVSQVFHQLDNIKRDIPVQFHHYIVFGRVPAIDPVNTIVSLTILYNGLPADAQQWVTPFLQFNPLSVTNGTATYPQLATLTGNGINDIICQNSNLNRLRFPEYVKGYDGASATTVYNLFNNATGQYPALNGSLMLFEGLATEAVDAITLSTTAVPVRQYYSLTSPVITYAPNPSLDAVAQQLGNSIRQTLYDTTSDSTLLSYVNYAAGNEELPAIYGEATWRVQKLLDLKAVYDPSNAFRWYAPVIPPS